MWQPDVQFCEGGQVTPPPIPAPPPLIPPLLPHFLCPPPGLCVQAPTHTTSVARLPGRNSGQKAQKGPQKKKFLAEFWLILPKTGRKGAAENLYIVY